MAQVINEGKSSELGQQLLAALEENTRAQRMSQVVGLASLVLGVAIGFRYFFPRSPKKPMIDAQAIEV